MILTILSLPPTSHDVKLMFLYSTVSTLKPNKTCCLYVSNIIVLTNGRYCGHNFA